MVASNLSYWRVGNPGERCLGAMLLADGEIERVLCHLPGLFRLLGELMYATGLRLEDLLRLRVRDVLADGAELCLRHDGEEVARRVRLSTRLAVAVAEQVRSVGRLFEADLAAGGFGSPLPAGFDRRFPLAGQRACLQHLFPSARVARDPVTGRWCRPPLEASAMHEALAVAGRAAGLPGAVQTHALRHAFAARMLKDGVPLEIMRKLMDHENVSTTEQYVAVLRNALEARKAPPQAPRTTAPTVPHSSRAQQPPLPLWDHAATDGARGGGEGRALVA